MSDRVSRLGPLLLIVVLAVVGTALALPLLTGDPAPVASPRIPLLVLLVLWAGFEMVTLYLQFGQEVDNAEELVLTDIPLALGMLLASPADLLVVGVAVPVVVDALRRRRSALKQLFNAMNRTVEVALAVTVYRALAPEPFSVEGWAALSVALVAAGLTSAVAVSIVISMVVGRLHGGEFVMHVSLALPVSLAAAAIAFVAGLSLQQGAVAVAPLAAATVAFLALIWVSSLVTERHRNLASMHELGERLASTRGVQAILRTALDAACQIVVAPQADVYLHPRSEGSTVLRLRRTPDGAHHETQVPPEGVPGARGLGSDMRSCAVSTQLTTGRDLVLSVARTAGASRAFRKADVRLLTMIARQTAAEVQTAQLIDRLRHDALHDALTGLPNRRRMLAAIDERLAGGAHSEVIWLGVHDLEAVNSALGYDRGDDLIVQIGNRLQAAAGPHAVVARVGGAEFAVLLPPVDAVATPPNGVAALLDTFARPFLLTDVQVVARASAGLAVESSSTVSTAEAMLRRADIAMRYARRTGRPAERYVSRLEPATADQLALAADLQSAIPGGELVLFGQPQVRLSDGVVTGIEALVRWSHPRLGMLGPHAFVPLAEQTGLDRPMTAWVLDAALTAQSGWAADGLPLDVSVNIPASALSDNHLRDLVRELLLRHQVSGRHLVLEITESGLFTSPATASRVLADLTELGVRVSIDDFGTGFSSLARLRRLPVDEIKIDRAFVGAMMSNDDDAAIVRSVVDLSRALGLACVAEGIEDAETYAALQRLGCGAAQGYLIAAPMPLGEVAEWVRSGASRLQQPQLGHAGEAGRSIPR